MAEVLETGEVRERARDAGEDDDDVLLEIERDGLQSLAEMADSLGWQAASGDADKERARRACNRLTKVKFIAPSAGRRGRRLTKAGREAIPEIRAKKHEEHVNAQIAACVVENGRVANRVEHETEEHDNTRL
jgi:hypothetical protein